MTDAKELMAWAPVASAIIGAILIIITILFYWRGRSILIIGPIFLIVGAFLLTSDKWGYAKLIFENGKLTTELGTCQTNVAQLEHTVAEGHKKIAELTTEYSQTTASTNQLQSWSAIVKAGSADNAWTDALTAEKLKTITDQAGYVLVPKKIDEQIKNFEPAFFKNPTGSSKPIDSQGTDNAVDGMHRPGDN